MAKEAAKENSHIIDSGKVGVVKIADDVVAVIAALAAREVDGVSTMVPGIGKTIMGYVGVKKGEDGVRIDIRDGVVRAALSINVQYGFPIPEVSRKVQEKVKSSIETMTGLPVAGVNIRVENISLDTSGAS
ncbi:MAG: Asp23/Gls24 family envelope stress response protein [Lachnospiraceae bacterium]|nr:Asp23/Gls24 family envelope stress response protein [Lachnospiraceae bacterium]